MYYQKNIGNIGASLPVNKKYMDRKAIRTSIRDFKTAISTLNSTPNSITGRTAGKPSTDFPVYLLSSMTSSPHSHHIMRAQIIKQVTKRNLIIGLANNSIKRRARFMGSSSVNILVIKPPTERRVV